MVTFVTLILSLITGPLPVEVAVAGEAAEVELLLDGRSVGVDRRPPWVVEVDFGPRLRPHELVAVARDADGREVGRARQLVNLPRPPAEVDVVLERDAAGVPVAAVAITENVAFEDAYDVAATLDGQLLPVDRDGRMELPELDPAAAHVLSVEASFVDGAVARRDVSFGGTWGGEVRTDLTAVAVRSDGRRAPSRDRVAAALRSDGEPVRVVAVERRGYRLFVVRDQASWPTLRLHGLRLDARQGPAARAERVDLSELVLEDGDDDGDALHLVHPVPELGGVPPRLVQLFQVSDPLTPTRVRGADWLVTHVVTGAPGGAQRLADAVAVSGVRAAGSPTPHAVVVVLSGEVEDGSSADPASVRRFLADLNVPLFVWRTGRGDDDGGWGRAVDVSTLGRLRSAFHDLERDLERQWVVWLEGEHLPHRLTAIAGGDVSLAGAPDR